jgi:hypothetical protein
MTGFATWLTDFENYETEDSYEAAMIQKTFVLNFITSYLPIFLTAFVYIPFGSIIVPYLNVFGHAMKPLTQDEKHLWTPKTGFQINRDRLRKQVIYFTVTAQIVNMVLEVILPYIKRSAFRQAKNIQGGAAKTNSKGSPATGPNDHPEESAFLTRVRNEAELGVYDVTTDLREMCMQVSGSVYGTRA